MAPGRKLPTLQSSLLLDITRPQYGPKESNNRGIDDQVSSQGLYAGSSPRARQHQGQNDQRCEDLGRSRLGGGPIPKVSKYCWVWSQAVFHTHKIQQLGNPYRAEVASGSIPWCGAEASQKWRTSSRYCDFKGFPSFQGLCQQGSDWQERATHCRFHENFWGVVFRRICSCYWQFLRWGRQTWVVWGMVIIQSATLYSRLIQSISGLETHWFGKLLLWTRRSRNIFLGSRNGFNFTRSFESTTIFALSIRATKFKFPSLSRYIVGLVRELAPSFLIDTTKTRLVFDTEYVSMLKSSKQFCWLYIEHRDCFDSHSRE